MIVRLALSVLVLALAPAAAAQTPERTETPEEAGLRIAREADRRDLGFGDSVAELRMILTNKRGDVSERKLSIRTLEIDEPGLGDKTLVVFDSPRDVKGTALLTHSRVLEPDDQWLFLPALKRVKRISSANKSGPFVGSEFAFEDMASPEVAKFSYRHLRDEPCGRLECFVLERRPLYRHSGYVRQIVWLDHEAYRIFKVEFYDRRDALLKTLHAADYRRYNDKFWRAHDLVMENHRTGKKTRLIWSAFEFGTGLTASDFTRSSLRRSR